MNNPHLKSWFEERKYYMYTFYDDSGDTLYIGSTYQLIERFKVHRRNTSLWSRVAKIAIRPLGTLARKEARKIEAVEVQRRRPIGNLKYVS